MVEMVVFQSCLFQQDRKQDEKQQKERERERAVRERERKSWEELENVQLSFH